MYPFRVGIHFVSRASYIHADAIRVCAWFTFSPSSSVGAWLPHIRHCQAQRVSKKDAVTFCVYPFLPSCKELLSRVHLSFLIGFHMLIYSYSPPCHHPPTTRCCCCCCCCSLSRNGNEIRFSPPFFLQSPLCVLCTPPQEVNNWGTTQPNLTTTTPTRFHPTVKKNREREGRDSR